MESEAIIDSFDESQGWNDETKLALCLEYIEAQKSNDIFRDFLQEKAAD